MSIFVTEVFQFLSDFQSQNTKRIKKIIVLQMRAISGRTFIKQGTTGANFAPYRKICNLETV